MWSCGPRRLKCSQCRDAENPCSAFMAATILWTLDMLPGTTASDTRMVVPQTHTSSLKFAEGLRGQTQRAHISMP